MRPRDFLPRATPELQIRIVERAHDDIGSGEDLDAAGKGTNRSAYVDRVNQRFGSPLGSFWCANAVAGWWKDAGAVLPPNPGNCEAWRVWAFLRNQFREAPQPGYAVLYGEPGHAHHIGVVARLVADLTAPAWGRRVLVIEGNTSLGVYNRDGWVVAEKIMDPTHLIGFVAPFATDP
jgi:hypothetical protein